jgi:glutamate synthase (NADPH/NADH) large chain
VPAGLDPAKGVKAYLKACDKGVLKTMAKMGISTLQSYRGAQIFEAIGLDRDLVERCFTGTASRVSGVGYDVLAREVALRHERAFPEDEFAYPELDPGGLYQWRRRGERHTFNPDTVSKLQHAVRESDRERAYATYKEFTKAADDDAERLCTLRGLFRFKAGDAVALDEVEPAAEIVKRFCTGAMSYGSISLGRPPDARGRDEPHRRPSNTARAARIRRASSRSRTATRAAARSSRSRPVASA